MTPSFILPTAIIAPHHSADLIWVNRKSGGGSDPEVKSSHSTM